ncbi:hypothetical protein EDC04DRAFT_2669991 [Pisolithus marmoratus]|nr:hypothetical protein EDC04DRAFT_2669991 [Pisolithus marmoratus]
MGIFKKFFSIGSKKSKRRFAANAVAQPTVPSTIQKNLSVSQEDDAEAAVSRLLRSSSARITVDSEVDFAALPPLPHPINTVVPPVAVLNATVSTVSQRSTYSVTVHWKVVHSRTEFPNAYPPMDKISTPKRSLTDSARRRSKSVPITPRDRNRLLTLRQDPSVASLLNHYDDKGCLDSGIFSNTPPSPPKEGRVQRRRTGSTLRQLLGHPSSPELRDSSTDGDISWADKFLGETDEDSSASSSGLTTPADTRFTDPHLVQADHSIAISAECDSVTYHRTFSSLEVELSMSTEQTHQHVPDHTMTPQKASEIFGFLTERKRALELHLSSRLPQIKATPDISSEFPQLDTRHPRMPRYNSTRIPQSISPPAHRRSSTISSPIKTNPSSSITIASQLRDNVHGTTKPLPPVTIHSTGQGTRGPRGPRAPAKLPSRSVNGMPGTGIVRTSVNNEHPGTRAALGEKSNLSATYPSPACTPAAKSHIPKLRTSSGSTVRSVESKESAATKGVPGPSHETDLEQGQFAMKSTAGQSAVTGVVGDDKENGLSRLPQPVTPVRPFGFRPSYLVEPPSPASSSELSPIAKQMMENLRLKRMQARQKDRQAGRLGSCHSRIRY